MAVPNPDYKPDWEEVYDFHDAERKRIEAEQSAIRDKENELYQAGVGYDSDEMLALNEQMSALSKQWGEHHSECLRCIDTYQHETIQDAAKWFFENITANIGVMGKGTIHQIDYDQFQTMEEVRAAWKRANDISKQMEADQRNSLKVGAPDGADIFTPMDDNQISSSWQIFNAATMGYNPGVTNDWHSHTLVTVDQREGEYHICFMHDPETHRGGGAPMNFIEDLASTMYRRAIASHEANKKPALSADGKGFSVRGLLSSFMKGASSLGSNDAPRPEQFNFYIHVRPEHTMKEIFCRVDMDFDGNGFHDPNFKHFDVIPEIIQQAYYETAMPTVTPSDILKLDNVR
ncbi:MAG: hypothetical protein AAF244_04730 [Pseudomonadota bacterium]